MDCKAVSDLIMKSLDNEITDEEKGILYGHIDACNDCSLEFEALKEIFFMLEDVELKEPSIGLEKIVISKIIKEDEIKARDRKNLTGIVSILVIIAGWALLGYLVLYTPAIGILKDSFDGLLLIAEGLFGVLLNITHVLFSIITKFWVIAKAFEVVGNVILEMYNIVLIAIIMFILMISSLYSNMLKTNRR